MRPRQDEPAKRRENPLTDRTTWIRFLYMLLFGLVLQLVELGLGLVAVVQLSAKLATGETFGQLRKIGRQMADYARHIIAFLTFDTEELPYPFAPSRVEDLRPGVRPSDGPGAPPPASDARAFGSSPS